MRSLILTLALLLLSVALLLGAAFHLAHCCDRLLLQLDAIPQKNDPAREVEEMKQYWEKKVWLLSIVLPRSEIEKVEEQLLTLSCHAQSPCKRYTEATHTTGCEHQTAIALLRRTLQKLKQDALPLSDRLDPR